MLGRRIGSIFQRSSSGFRGFHFTSRLQSSLPSFNGAPRTGSYYEDAVDGVVSTILEGAAHDKAHRDQRVILAVLVDNDPGVLNKVSGLLSARGFNIESLTVSPTNLEAMSRMTIVIRDATEEKAAQAIKQLQDVVNVLAVVDYTGTNSLHVRAVCWRCVDMLCTLTPFASPPYHPLHFSAGTRYDQGILYAPNGQCHL